MIIDQVQITAIAKILKEHISGSRVNKIYEPRKDLIIIDLFPTIEKKILALCTNRQFGFTGLIDCDLKNPSSPPTFCSLLRNRLKSAIITDVYASKTDRIINIVFSHKEDGGLINFPRLQLRLTGNKPNLLLFDGSNVPQGKLHNYSNHKGTVSEDKDYESIDNVDRTKKDWNIQLKETIELIKNCKTSKELYTSVPLLSPPLAKIIIKNCSNQNERNQWAKWIDETQNGENKICVHRIRNNLSGDTYLSPYLFPLIPANSSVIKENTLLESVESFYFAGLIKQELTNSKRNLLKALTKAKKKLTRKKCNLEEGLKNARESEYYIHQGELLKSVLYKIEKNTKSITAFDWLKNKEITLTINPMITPKANLEKLFAKATKIKRSLPILKKQVKETIAILSTINLLLEQTENSTSILDIDNIKHRLDNSDLLQSKSKTAKLKRKNKSKGSKQKKSKNKSKKEMTENLRTFNSSDGYKIYVGRNGKDNAFLSGKFLSKNDLWLHVKDSPGPHVVIKSKNKNKYPPHTKNEAGQLAVYFSSKRYEKRVDVLICEGFNVRNISGGKPGEVSLRKYNCITVKPDSDLINKLITMVMNH